MEGDSLLPVRTGSVFALENGTHHRDRNVVQRILVEYSVPGVAVVVRFHGANVVRQRVVSTGPCQLIQNKQQSSHSQPPHQQRKRLTHSPTLTPLFQSTAAARCRCCSFCLGVYFSAATLSSCCFPFIMILRFDHHKSSSTNIVPYDQFFLIQNFFEPSPYKRWQSIARL